MCQMWLSIVAGDTSQLEDLGTTSSIPAFTLQDGTTSLKLHLITIWHAYYLLQNLQALYRLSIKPLAIQQLHSPTLFCSTLYSLLPHICSNGKPAEAQGRKTEGFITESQEVED